MHVYCVIEADGKSDRVCVTRGSCDYSNLNAARVAANKWRVNERLIQIFQNPQCDIPLSYSDGFARYGFANRCQMLL